LDGGENVTFFFDAVVDVSVDGSVCDEFVIVESEEAAEFKDVVEACLNWAESVESESMWAESMEAESVGAESLEAEVESLGAKSVPLAFLGITSIELESFDAACLESISAPLDLETSGCCPDEGR
jgi:hypothetical protein